MNQERINEITDAIKNCTIGNSTDLEINIDNYKFDEKSDDYNQFIIALKPEMTKLNKPDIKDILNDISDNFGKFSISVGAIKVIPANYLKNNDILKHVYPTLYSISKLGIDKFTMDINNKLHELLKKLNIKEYEVYGAFEFIEKFPDFTALSLETLSRNLPTYKLGNGCYCIVLTVKGENIVVLNPFHPYQREWFHSSNSCLVVFECRSKSDYKIIRKECIGELEPENSPEGSLKKKLFERRYGINIINTAYNGYHISPGLIEGLRLILYFFLDNDINKINQTSLGRLLKLSGLSNNEIISIMNNDIVNEFTGESLYDSSEFMNNEEVLSMILKVRNRNLNNI